MTPVELRGNAILRRLPADGSVVEVGTAEGRLAEWLLSRRCDVHLIVVDNWQLPSRQPERYRATGDVNTQISDGRMAARPELVRRKLAVFGERVRVIQLPSVDAANSMRDESQAVVFIDADHSREAVTEDIAAWWPKVKPGGWLGGHDYANPDPRFRFGVTAAVDEFVVERRLELELDDNLTWWIRC